MSVRSQKHIRNQTLTIPRAAFLALTSTSLARSIISQITRQLPLSPNSHSSLSFSSIRSISLFVLCMTLSKFLTCDSITPKCLLNSAGHFACCGFFVNGCCCPRGRADVAAAFLAGFSGFGRPGILDSWLSFLTASLSSLRPFFPCPLPMTTTQGKSGEVD